MTYKEEIQIRIEERMKKYALPKGFNIDSPVDNSNHNEYRKTARYTNGTCAIANNIVNCINTAASDMVSQRDDFNDMFRAECDYRDKRGDVSIVFVLTYNEAHLHKVFGRNMLNAEDLKMYAKSSRIAKFLERNGYSFDFVCIGEYGEGGKSHNYVGKRGRGNNPHYHCVGWFHKFDENKPVIPSHTLYNILRYEWQRSYVDDIVEYSKNIPAESLGFVCLDGPVKSSLAGSRYISKYMGKDIKKWFISAANAGLYPHIYNFTCIYLVNTFRYVDDNLVWSYLYVMCKEYKDCPLLFRHIENLVETSCGRIKINECLFLDGDEWLDIIAGIHDEYLRLYHEFNKQMNTTFSPKLRKFHGFGYSLFHEDKMRKVNKFLGTYTVDCVNRSYTRNFPPSIIRHYYYKHIVYNDEVGNKVVRYELNNLGRQYVAFNAKKKIEKYTLIARSAGSDNLKEHARTAANFLVCLKCYSVEQSTLEFLNLDEILNNSDSAVKWLLKCKPVNLPTTLTPALSVYVNILEVLKITYSNLYGAVVELDEILSKQLVSKNEKDKDFCNSWYRVLMSVY